MTGYINRGVKNSISRLTVASLEDMGYQVNMDAANDYSLPGPLILAELSAAPTRRQCSLLHQETPFIVNGNLLNITAREVTFMEQTSWNLSLNTTSGLTQGDVGSVDVGASTSIPVTLDPATSVDLDLQLTNTDKLDVLSIASSIYDGAVEVTSNGNTYKLTGPLLLFGDLIARFSSDLSTLSIENTHLTDTAELKILIGRTLV